MGLYKTSIFSIFTFIKDNDLKFCTRSYSSCAYRMMRFKGSNGKVCKTMTSHFRNLYCRKRLENPIFIVLSHSIAWKCFPWYGNILEIKLPYCGRGPDFPAGKENSVAPLHGPVSSFLVFQMPAISPCLYPTLLHH